MPLRSQPTSLASPLKPTESPTGLALAPTGTGFYNLFDEVIYPNVNTKSLFPQAYFTGAGFGYWFASCNLPAGTKLAWGFNLLTGSSSEGVAQVRQIERVFKLVEEGFYGVNFCFGLQHRRCSHIELDAIAMGNEVDLWDDGDRRPENRTIYDYKDEQIEYFNAITDALGPNNNRKFRVSDFASSWSTSQILNTGLMESEMGSSVTIVSEHRYQGSANMDGPSAWPSQAAELMEKEFS
ncbi:hypothetical protein BDV06DRAFT_225600 [Aspergillus oleicola]